MKRIIISTVCLISLIVHSQSPDLGIQLNNDASQRLILEYRTPFSEKWKFNLGANFGASNEVASDGIITAVSDTMISEMVLRTRRQYASLRVGVERQLGTSMFSIGSDLFLTYRNSHFSYHGIQTRKDTSGRWVSFHQVSPPTSDATNQVTHHHIIPAFNLSIEMNVPLNDFFLLNIHLGGNMNMPFFIAESQRNDPDQILFKPSGIRVINLAVNAGVGLRYRFGQ